MSPISWVLVALYALAFLVFLLRVAYQVGHNRGYDEGYRMARTLPIGRVRRLIKNAGGFDAIAEIEGDVIIIPGDIPGEHLG